MPSLHSKPEQTSDPLLRAKRIFLLNLALFISLTAATVLLMDTGKGSEEIERSSAETAKSYKKPSKLELAKLKGQMRGLRERPKTVPEYDAEWVRKVSKQAIQRDPAFEGTTDSELEALAQAFFEGYSNRYQDYHDDRHAYLIGAKVGLMYDPFIHRAPNKAQIEQRLNQHKVKIMQKYQFDEARWQLYCKAFEQGLLENYFKTEDGVTRKVRERIEWRYY